MTKVTSKVDETKLKGIGNLQFHRANNLTLSPWLGGYSMEYRINEFN